MGINKRPVTFIISALAGLIGCTDGASGPVLDDELTSSTEQESEFWRNDQAGRIWLDEGPWGEWKPRIYCNQGSWAVGYQMRVEGSQGGGDDTALNSVRLQCKDYTTGATEWISSYDGNWGGWYSSVSCPSTGNYLKGARIRIEGSQGGGDDTAANNVQFTCTGGNTIYAPGGHSWGSWGSLMVCPANSAVCGLAIKFENSQAGGDDTAMNGLSLDCCTLPFCNGSCGDGTCNPVCEGQWSCPSPECGYPCGDGICTSGYESSYSCPSDCGPPPPYCGDGWCNGGESSSWCPEDCGSGGGCLRLPCPM